MSPEVFVDIMSRSLYVVIVLVTLIILPSLIVGLVVSIFQAATSINEQTLSFLPRLLITLFALIFAGHWIIRYLTDFTLELYEAIPTLVG